MSCPKVNVKSRILDNLSLTLPIWCLYWKLVLLFCNVFILQTDPLYLIVYLLCFWLCFYQMLQPVLFHPFLSTEFDPPFLFSFLPKRKWEYVLINVSVYCILPTFKQIIPEMKRCTVTWKSIFFVSEHVCVMLSAFSIFLKLFFNAVFIERAESIDSYSWPIVG